MRAVSRTLPEIMEGVAEKGFPWALDAVFETFNQIIRIDHTQSWKKILHDTSEIIVDFLGAQAATIRLHEPYLNQMISFGSYQFDEDQREQAISFETTIAGRVVATQKSITVSDILQSPDFEDNAEARSRFRSLMAVPLTIERFLENEDDVHGALQIYFADGPRDFQDIEIRIAEMLAQRVSYVLARKRILDLRRVNEKKEWLVEKVFSKISHDRTLKMKDLFRMMLEELTDIIRIQSCTLFTLSEGGEEAVLETGYPEAGGYHTVGSVFPLEEHPYLRAAVRQDIPYGDFSNERVYPSYILIKNPQASELVTQNLRRFAQDHGINSILYVPLRIGDRVRHILVFDAVDRTRYFSDEDIEILTFFGKELTQALEIERLDDILHDFKNPAIAIAGFARRVRRMISAGWDDRAEMLKFMDVVIHEGMRIQEMAMSLYPVSQAEDIDLVEVARDRFLINREAIEEKKLNHIRVEEEAFPAEALPVTVSRLALERVLDNLLNNATKAVPPGGGYLRIRAFGGQGEAVVEISNSGRVAPEDVAKLSTADFKGRGLNIIYRMVRSIGGRVEVDVQADHTTFRVTLPLSPPEA